MSFTLNGMPFEDADLKSKLGVTESLKHFISKDGNKNYIIVHIKDEYVGVALKELSPEEQAGQGVFKNFGGVPTPIEFTEYNDHWSPAEHQARLRERLNWIENHVTGRWYLEVAYSYTRARFIWSFSEASDAMMAKLSW